VFFGRVAFSDVRDQGCIYRLDSPFIRPKGTFLMTLMHKNSHFCRQNKTAMVVLFWRDSLRASI